jgi:hypothetical protein
MVTSLPQLVNKAPSSASSALQTQQNLPSYDEALSRHRYGASRFHPPHTSSPPLLTKEPYISGTSVPQEHMKNVLDSHQISESAILSAASLTITTQYPTLPDLHHHFPELWLQQQEVTCYHLRTSVTHHLPLHHHSRQSSAVWPRALDHPHPPNSPLAQIHRIGKVNRGIPVQHCRTDKLQNSRWTMWLYLVDRMANRQRESLLGIQKVETEDCGLWKVEQMQNGRSLNWRMIWLQVVSGLRIRGSEII